MTSIPTTYKRKRGPVPTWGVAKKVFTLTCTPQAINKLDELCYLINEKGRGEFFEHMARETDTYKAWLAAECERFSKS